MWDGGETSDDSKLASMIFQGTVWGPTLWNIFDEDARKTINEMHFTEVVFADDLNAYHEFTSDPKENILKGSKACRVDLHRWGEAN